MSRRSTARALTLLALATALAAALAGWALDVPTDLICAGLRTFDPAGKNKKAK